MVQVQRHSRNRTVRSSEERAVQMSRDKAKRCYVLWHDTYTQSHSMSPCAYRKQALDKWASTWKAFAEKWPEEMAKIAEEYSKEKQGV
jgi:hypothetical protein